MTTSWSHLVRGRPISSFQSNAGGAVLGIVALVLTPWAFVSAIRGRWFLGPIGERTALGIVGFVLLVTMLDWIVRVGILAGSR
jgi:hypothetical protein